LLRLGKKAVGGWEILLYRMPLRTPGPLHSFLYAYVDRVDLFLVLYGTHVHI
jgi:hypothetical protein